MVIKNLHKTIIFSSLLALFVMFGGAAAVQAQTSSYNVYNLSENYNSNNNTYSGDLKVKNLTTNSDSDLYVGVMLSKLNTQNNSLEYVYTKIIDGPTTFASESEKTYSYSFQAPSDMNSSDQYIMVAQVYDSNSVSYGYGYSRYFQHNTSAVATNKLSSNFYKFIIILLILFIIAFWPQRKAGKRSKKFSK